MSMSDMGPTTGNVNHVANLCVCLHSRLIHHTVLGAHNHYPSSASPPVTDQCAATMPDGSKCRCNRFNVVSKTSTHAFHRGMKSERKRVVDLYPGDRVLTGWTTYAGRIRLLDHKTGAMVSEVKHMQRALADDDPRAAGQDWRQRCWLVTTDLGTSFPQAGGDVVYVVNG